MLKYKIMSKIGLIDVDGHNFPNLALMKISAYHKNMGDTVEFVNYFDFYDRNDSELLNIVAWRLIEYK